MFVVQPGLAFFYGGLVPRKSVLTIMMQARHHIMLEINLCNIWFGCEVHLKLVS